MLRLGGSAAGLAAVAVAAVNKPPPVQTAETEKPGTAVVIGGGILGLSTSLQLAERGVKVTLIEAKSKPAQVASYYNGAILCQSMAASWASATLIAKNPGELQSMRIGWSAWTDPAFYRWSGWFWFNSLWPGRAEYNHQSQRELAFYSLKYMEEEIEKFGEKVDMNKTAKETIKLFHNKADMEDFMKSSQARFWEERGFAFRRLSVQEYLDLEPGIANLDDWEDGKLGNQGLVGGVLSSVDSSGDISIYCSNLEKLCKEKGVTLQYGTPVSSFDVKDNRIRGVQLESGEICSGDVYVLAVGASSQPIGQQLGLNLPVYPLKGHLTTVHSNPDSPALSRNIYSPRHGLLSPLGPRALRLSGGVEAVGYDYTVEPEKGKNLISKAEGVMKPNYIQTDQATYHSCLRPVCCDDVAIIGRTLIPNLYVNTGQGSKGWTFSWGSAVLLAQIISGEATDLDPARYTPNRFHPFKSRTSL